MAKDRVLMAVFELGAEEWGRRRSSTDLPKPAERSVPGGIDKRK